MAGTTLAAVAARPAMTRASAGELLDRFDIVVAGAGHDSLIAAAYLAKADWLMLYCLLHQRTISAVNISKAR
jgi:ribulose 1,5-bisphosphate synthetase/thiazole synthase